MAAFAGPANGGIETEVRLERSQRSQKVSITMPEELHKRLEAVRDKFSISAVCQRALEVEIRIHELAMKGDDMAAIVERLKLEKAQLGVSSRQEGIKEGIKWAKEMSYQELRAMEQFRIFEVDPLPYKSLTVEWMGDASIKQVTESFRCYLGDLQEELVEHLEIEGQAPEYDTREYFIGWLIGVFEFYHEIEDKIGAIPLREQVEKGAAVTVTPTKP